MFNFLVFAGLVAVDITDLVPADENLPNPRNSIGTSRVIGGSPTSIENAPYQVSLQHSGIHFCGGSIISQNWVLTAAHCAGFSADLISVLAGTNTLSSGGSSHSVKNIIKHEKFKVSVLRKPVHDIALIEVETPFKFDTTRRPIEMCNLFERTMPGSMAIVTGWGAIVEDGYFTNVLQTASAPLISKLQCNLMYLRFGGISRGQICITYRRQARGSCSGDSGGPLTVNGRLIGITSWGNGCAKRGYPSVFTEVASYRDWIRKKTGI